ncbi:hypothetical protein IWW50_001784 [Coemansia erecta]|nr:hypothetical protein IWW50_001784 [Coemansia erecta]
MDDRSNTPPRRRGTPQIHVELQAPHLARTTEPTTTSPLYTSGMTRLQLRDTPAPPPTTRTTDHSHAETTAAALATTKHTYNNAADHDKATTSRTAPETWDPQLVLFLERFSSAHALGLESLSVWQDELGRLRVPPSLTGAAAYLKHVGHGLSTHAPTTGNLQWATFHMVAGLRALKTVDFLGDAPPALLVLVFVVRASWRALRVCGCARLDRVLVDQPPVSGSVDLLVDKARAQGEDVRARAFVQTQADAAPLYRQALHLGTLGVSHLDAQGALYHGLLSLLVEVLAPPCEPSPEPSPEPGLEPRLQDAPDVLARDMLRRVGPSSAFNVASTQAEELVHALLINSISAPAAQGLVQSAYTYLFARTDAPRTAEHASLMVLLLLVAQRAPNPFKQALAELRDTPDTALRVDTRVPFRRLFERLAAELASVEWTLLFHTIVTCNDAFRTYVLARTDPDTLVVPLLRRVGQATALAVPLHTRGPDPSGAPPAGRAELLRRGAQLPCAVTLETIPYDHVYLWLGILLVLSEDAQFVGQLQRTAVEFWPAPPQALHGQALSQCVVAEMVRVFQLNIMHVRDSHLHGLALGTLANVLNGAQRLAAPLAQKLVRLFEMIHRRHARLDACRLPGGEAAEHAVYGQTLAVLLALFCRLAHSENPQFIYCLLQAREALGAFRGAGANGGPARAAAAELRVRIAYFHARVAALPSPQPRDILHMIEAVVAAEAHPDPLRVDFCALPPAPARWSDYMLPLVWELLLSSPPLDSLYTS